MVAKSLDKVIQHGEAVRSFLEVLLQRPGSEYHGAGNVELSFAASRAFEDARLDGTQKRMFNGFVRRIMEAHQIVADVASAYDLFRDDSRSVEFVRDHDESINPDAVLAVNPQAYFMKIELNGEPSKFRFRAPEVTVNLRANKVPYSPRSKPALKTKMRDLLRTMQWRLGQELPIAEYFKELTTVSYFSFQAISGKAAAARIAEKMLRSDTDFTSPQSNLAASLIAYDNTSVPRDHLEEHLRRSAGRDVDYFARKIEWAKHHSNQQSLPALQAWHQRQVNMLEEKRDAMWALPDLVLDVAREKGVPPSTLFYFVSTSFPGNVVGAQRFLEARPKG